MLYYKYSKGKKGEKKMIKVVFRVSCDEIVEFDDDTTEKEISEAYEQWLPAQGIGWDYYEDEDE